MIPITELNSTKNKKNIKFNPFDPEFKTNPYPTYEYLRIHDPVHQGLLGGWVLTRYADVKSVLRDPRFDEVPIPQGVSKKSQYLVAKKQKNLESLAESSRQWLFFLDPPDHTRMRNLVGKAFKNKPLQQMTPMIQVVTDDLIARVKPEGKMDIIADFADLLPSTVIARIIGLPAEDDPIFRIWSRDLFRIFDPLMSLKTCERMNQVAEEFIAYLQAQIAERRKQPQADLLTALINVDEQGEQLTEAEIIGTCMMMFTAGEQTSAAIIGNGMLALLNHPDQLTLLKQKPEILPTAIEEILRYDSPTQLVARMANEPVMIGETNINKGDYVILCLGAANRDPEQFPNPNKFDLQRTENAHIAFATGIHYCLGAALARVELPIAISSLVQQIPQPKLATDKLEYRENVVLRYLKSLPITFEEV